MIFHYSNNFNLTTNRSHTHKNKKLSKKKTFITTDLHSLILL